MRHAPRAAGPRRSGQTRGGGPDPSRGQPRARSGPRCWAAWGAVRALRLYRVLISPLYPPACRFYPTCSAYAAKAYELHGFWKGSRLALGRLLRCHPFHPGGWDPVPDDPDSFEELIREDD
ncbi:MAG: membrane protein insertion efficiency factor YidD [Deltaproteobacteria bacterium]|nr:membrane protein insertion efficiency factor YidD [Deltaproteobacteria bacterium]